VTRIKIALALVAAFASILAGVFLIASQGAYASSTPGPSFATCDNLKGWYANPDEQDQLPAPTEDGLKFTDKNLIHHATSGIDLADMDHVTTSFVATTAGKVVFKVETSAPYSTIITNADGKVWSTAMTYDQEGGQGHPVAHYSDLVGEPTKPGKAPFTSASMVVTFGVGYWVEEGSTVVSSISFHGTTYPLTCVQHTATAPVSSASTSTKPVHSGVPSHAVSSTSHAAGALTGGGTSGTGSALAITGPPVGFIAGGAAVLLAAGGALIYGTRRRRTTFSA
jgi:hypothetical protein